MVSIYHRNAIEKKEAIEGPRAQKVKKSTLNGLATVPACQGEVSPNVLEGITLGISSSTKTKQWGSDNTTGVEPSILCHSDSILNT